MARLLSANLTAAVLLTATPLALHAQKDCGCRVNGQTMEVVLWSSGDNLVLVSSASPGTPSPPETPGTSSKPGTHGASNSIKIVGGGDISIRLVPQVNVDPKSVKVEKPKFERPKKKSFGDKSPASMNEGPSADRDDRSQDQAWDTEFLVDNMLPDVHAARPVLASAIF